MKNVKGFNKLTLNQQGFLQINAMHKAAVGMDYKKVEYQQCKTIRRI